MPHLVGFYLTCSQQQLVVPQGIRGRLIFRLSAPYGVRPQTSRHPQAYHTPPPGSGGWLTQTIFVPGGVPGAVLTYLKLVCADEAEQIAVLIDAIDAPRTAGPRCPPGRTWSVMRLLVSRTGTHWAGHAHPHCFTAPRTRHPPTTARSGSGQVCLLATPDFFDARADGIVGLLEDLGRVGALVKD
jgi:hypothetical protein